MLAFNNQLATGTTITFTSYVVGNLRASASEKKKDREKGRLLINIPHKFLSSQAPIHLTNGFISVVTDCIGIPGLHCTKKEAKIVLDNDETCI